VKSRMCFAGNYVVNYPDSWHVSFRAILSLLFAVISSSVLPPERIGENTE